MRLRSVSVMVVVPLAIAIGGVILLTPKDILRRPVLGGAAVMQSETVGPTSSATRIPIVEFDEQAIRPATLVVAATMPESEARPEAASADRRWIIARALNVRTGPSVNDELIASLPYGTPVDVLDTSGTWALIEAGDVSGWLSANFLTTTDPGN